MDSSLITWLVVLLVVILIANGAFSIASRRLYGLQVLISRRGSDVFGQPPPPGRVTRLFFGYGFMPFLFSQVGRYVVNGEYRDETDDAIRKAGDACRAAVVSGTFLTLVTAGFLLLVAFLVLR